MSEQQEPTDDADDAAFDAIAQEVCTACGEIFMRHADAKSSPAAVMTGAINAVGSYIGAVPHTGTRLELMAQSCFYLPQIVAHRVAHLRATSEEYRAAEELAETDPTVQ